MMSQITLLEPSATSIAQFDFINDTRLSKAERLAKLETIVSGCRNCGLCEARIQTVFAHGNPESPLMVIGEGPGQQEDEQGLPFVGRSGKLLTQILESVDFKRPDDVYIANIVKCRPPNNRAPLKDEMQECFNYLKAQIEIVQPYYILLAGATAVKGILGTKQGITKIRGQWFETPYQFETHSAKAMPIFHPSYLLRNPSKEHGKPKWLMWQDVQEVRRAVDAL